MKRGGIMAGPYLEKGESFIATTHRISVDFVLYDMMLTTRHLILIDNSSPRIEIRKIPLITVLSVAAGRVATGEPVITLSFTAEDSTEPVLPMNLLFKQQAAENRKRERDEWIRKLMELIVAVRQPAELADKTPENLTEGPGISAPAPMRAVELPLPHKSVIGSESEPVNLEIIPDEPEVPVAEKTPGPASPIASTVSEIIPEAGQEEAAVTAGTVQAEPAGGTVIPGETEGPGEEPAKAVSNEPEIAVAETGQTPPVDLFTAAALAVEESAAASAIPAGTPGASRMPSSPVQKTGLLARLARSLGLQKKGRDHAAEKPEESPVAETDIRVSGEPEEVVPVPETAVVVPAHAVHEEPLPHQPESTPAGPSTVPEPAIEISAVEPTEEQIPSQQEMHAEEKPAQQLPDLPPAAPPAPGTQRTVVIAAAVIIILIIIAGGMFYTLKYGPGHTGIPATPIITPLPATPVPSAPAIPSKGLWLRVTSNSSFVGYFGNPGDLRHVGGSGDRFYSIPDAGRLLQVSFQKQDYSGEILEIRIYRNGTMITSRSVRTPQGSIEFIIDTATGGFPGGIPAATTRGGMVPGEVYRY
jgi:hypothetical protein